ncbi:hypothetical protein SUNI508_06572 [Seiridium unicorne]|uniref:Uncharacterized protein n=1 Tax=Seiridium unicorne TaxID=138068 RepID=A0ABR2V039_9PEZI
MAELLPRIQAITTYATGQSYARVSLAR